MSGGARVRPLPFAPVSSAPSRDRHHFANFASPMHVACVLLEHAISIANRPEMNEPSGNESFKSSECTGTQRKRGLIIPFDAHRADALLPEAVQRLQKYGGVLIHLLLRGRPMQIVVAPVLPAVLRGVLALGLRRRLTRSRSRAGLAMVVRRVSVATRLHTGATVIFIRSATTHGTRADEIRAIRFNARCIAGVVGSTRGFRT